MAYASAPNIVGTCGDCRDAICDGDSYNYAAPNAETILVHEECAYRLAQAWAKDEANKHWILGSEWPWVERVSLMCHGCSRPGIACCCP